MLQKRGISRNTDFPQIVINSIPAPELIHNRISAEELEPYTRGLKELDSFGVDFIVMVCNTIHLFRNEMQKQVKADILDLRKGIELELERRCIKSAVVLGTPATIKGGLYKSEGVRLLDVSEADITSLSGAIFNFNRGFEKEEQVGVVLGVAEKYLSGGAEAVILGCTELSAMMKDKELPKIDTIALLVDMVMEMLEGGGVYG